MRPEDYPPQEPMSAMARSYHDEVMRRGAGVTGEEIAYGADPYQSILVCRAAKPDGNLLAVMHGGGWTNGYKEWLAFMAPPLTAAGITFASIGYRLAPQHVFPTGLSDARAGVALLRERAADFGADPARLFVGGHSAGGHYAALMTVRSVWEPGASPRPGSLRGCLPISGVFDFGPQSGLPQRPRFLGDPAAQAEGPASPIENIKGTPPPFFLTWGSDDFPHLIPQAKRMAAALAAAGGTVDQLELAGCNHFTASYEGGNAEGRWVGRAVEWMRAQ
jgi:arylformamidase